MDAPAHTTVRQRFDQRRAEAIQAYRKHLRPDTLLAALRRIADQAIKETVKSHPLPNGAALAAVGGYGRGELFPYSDIDVLILLQEDPNSDDRARIEKLV